jgi:hypothetical protein
MLIKGFTQPYLPEVEEIIKWENKADIHRLNSFTLSPKTDLEEHFPNMHFNVPGSRIQNRGCEL